MVSRSKEKGVNVSSPFLSSLFEWLFSFFLSMFSDNARVFYASDRAVVYFTMTKVDPHTDVQKSWHGFIIRFKGEEG